MCRFFAIFSILREFRKKNPFLYQFDSWIAYQHQTLPSNEAAPCPVSKPRCSSQDKFPSWFSSTIVITRRICDSSRRNFIMEKESLAPSEKSVDEVYRLGACGHLNADERGVIAGFGRV